MFRWIGQGLETLRQRFTDAADRKREKEEDDALWASSMFTALSGHQIEAILAIVKQEVKWTTSHYGHIIRRADVLKEKCFFPLAFQKMGGVLLLSKRISFEEAQEAIYAEMEVAFKEELEHYSDVWNGMGSRVWYRCHLQSVANALLHAIWNGKIPLI